jgi:signal transduction histidine kinase
MECFAAYAAHELRGEVTLQLALAGIALAEPDADTIALRQLAERVVASCKRQERLLEALLTLAKGEYGELKREPIDLAATVADILRGYDHHPIRRSVTLQPAVTIGDSKLVERLAANLVENAMLHNIPNGRLDLATPACSDPSSDSGLPQSRSRTASDSALRSCKRSPTRTTPPSPHTPQPAAVSS